MDTYKQLAPEDIVKKRYTQISSTYTITSSINSLTSDVTLMCIGGGSGFAKFPDSSGSTTSNISLSGAMNQLAMDAFNRYSSTYFDSSNDVYTIPYSHSAVQSASFAKLITIGRPTLNMGIYPDSLTAVLYYASPTVSSTVTAIDTASDSLGPNKSSLEYGALVDASNTANVVGTIFYYHGLVLLHGGLGGAFAQTINNLGNKFFWSNNAATSVSGVISLQSLAFRTYAEKVENIYFLHAGNNEFNYTSNPSARNVAFLQDENNATVYITSVGLFDSRDNLLAVAKLSPPLKKNKFISRLIAVSISI